MKRINLSIFAGLLMSAFAFSATAGEMRVCTGKSGGNYEYTGKVIAKQLSDQNVTIVNTAGSWENLQRLSSGECDVAVVQSDSLYLWGKEQGQLAYMTISPLYTEYAHLLCRRNSKVTEFADLNANTKVFSGGRGSGADVTIRGLVKADDEYGNKSYTKVPLVNEESADVSLVKLKGGQADCLFYVGSKGNKFMSVQAEKLAADLVLVPISDKDFNDVTMNDTNGNEISVWNPVVMDNNTYKNIMPSGVFSNKDLDTIGVTAMVIASDSWINSNTEGFAALGLSIPDIANIIRVEKGVTLED